LIGPGNKIDHFGFENPPANSHFDPVGIPIKQGLDEAMTPKAITLTIRTMFGFGPRKIASLLHNILHNT
jgi:hypothetical protein